MYKNNKILSVILARAGSKGIKLKNVRYLLGQPLFMWSVGASLASKYVDYTVVSSNCEHVKRKYEEFLLLDDFFIDENKEKSVRNKIAWIDRPEEYATDTSINEEALIHAIKVLKGEGTEFNSVVTLQPTSPIRNGELLDKCIKSYYDGDYDSLVTGMKHTPFFWRKLKNKWIYDIDRNDCCNRKMRQDFIDNESDSEFVFHDDGNFYQTDTKILLQTKCRLGKRICFYETDKFQSLQIDEEIDFQLIENLAKLKGINSLI